MKSKTCSKCKEEKSESDFYLSSKATDRLQSWCKECAKKNSLEWEKVHLEKRKAAKCKTGKVWEVKNRKRRKAQAKQWKLLNPEKVKAQKRRSYPRYYAKNNDLIKARRRKAYRKIKNSKKWKKHRREKHLLQAYGLTLVKIQAMHKKQRGKCAICRKRLKKFHVDHCHRSGKVRGLLCLKCNFGIGMFFDCVKNLGSAIKYLRRNRKL